MPSLAALLLLPALASGAVAASGARVVPRAEIVAAMRSCQGYDLTATTNGPRFQAEVLLALLRANRVREPGGAVLFLGHADWFAAYLVRTGLAAESAPLFMRLSDQHRQDLEVDDRAGRVVERVIEGLRGRPTEGFLGVLFDLIGEGHIEWSRMAISADGLQVSRARASKGFFHVESSITVFPDGRVEKDLAKGRPDLLPLDERVRRPLQIRYLPLDRQHAPAEVGR